MKGGFSVTEDEITISPTSACTNFGEDFVWINHDEEGWEEALATLGMGEINTRIRTGR
ncbi:MAG: hypothetical protein JXB49_09745 [Bacteroidales bacterium]|nr:hypothetical protein [Bacteroidales bacterium]